MEKEKCSHTNEQGALHPPDKGPDFVRPTEQELKKRLTPLQYQVTQCKATESPFEDNYWNNKQPGIYIDIISGVPLFSSTHQFDSASGWPSFFRPIKEKEISLHEDYSLSYRRTEVRSRLADAHLGHLFTDGPPPTGLRYCINYAALKFIEKNKLKETGYSALLSLFS